MFTCIFFKSFFHVLLAPKRTKRPVTGKISHNSLLLTSRKRHPSVGCGAVAHSFGELKLPSSQTLLARNGANKSFHSVFGWCETPSVSHSQSERLTSSQTVLTTLSKNRMGFVCDFDGDGFSLILPLSAIKLIPRQRRNGTVEKSNGGPLVFRPLCEAVCRLVWV